MSSKNNSLECLQDGLFFGLEYLQQKFPLTQLSSYAKSSDLIFKGQKIISLEESPKSKSQKEALSFLLSYLSGAYTLISCFTERHFDFKIIANSTQKFLHQEGEKQAIVKAGALLNQNKEKPSLNFQELLKELEKTNPQESYLLNTEKLSLKEITNILQNYPSHSFEIKAKLLPSDLEQWRDFKNIQAVQPFYLQGHFPLLKMKWTQ